MTHNLSSTSTGVLKQCGLSLVELMVGLTIGLVLTLGLFTLIGNQSQAFKVQDDFARIQENGTLALRYIGDSVRMAGFYGYVMDATNVNTTIGAVTMAAGATDDCGSGGNLPTTNWALAVTTPLQAFSPATATAANTLLPCIRTTNFLLPSPVLVTRSAAGYRIPDPNADGNLSDGLAAQPGNATTIYLQGDPNAGLIFNGAGFAGLRAAGSTRSTAAGADIDIFEYRVHVYYIRPCSRPAAGNACAATDDGGRPVPTLARQELVGNALNEVPLVEGIERIDFQFGIDAQPPVGPNNVLGDGVPERFTATPASADWPNVVAVKVSVLVRSPTPSPQYDDSTKTYDLNGDNVADYNCTLDVVTPRACTYKRKVFSQTFQVRNIAQRRGG